jgi:transcriptional regulator with XRE-family HTH domain
MGKRYSSLADYLARSGETQEQLAARADVSQPTISRALSGKGSFRVLKKLSDLTGVPLESFGKQAA